ncbi:hypothetical protein [Chryseobacterium sp. R2A-55]|uniref:hypothetical protein n=1 Tax=Chryseobacterium sp. R2A-55 TaxID=2744445 RepID=UPI001F298797|nr:hypothetical protein [Chryseobacterium sp. R2A-55]
MPKITNLTNFTGTINGLVYYTVNGQQFIRAEKAKTNKTKSKELPKKLLPGIEALQISNALHSMNHLVNAMEKEFQTLKTPTRPQRKNDPAIKEFHGASSGSGSTAATTAELEEKESVRADFHTDNGKSPVLENAIRDHTEIKFTVRGAKPGLHLIILQINYETGDFRRKKKPRLTQRSGSGKTPVRPNRISGRKRIYRSTVPVWRVFPEGVPCQ